MAETQYSAGLEDVVAATSEICFIDGEEGRLVYRGYDIHDLVKGGCTFEEVIFLLWNGELPTQAQLNEFNSTLRAERALNPCSLYYYIQIPQPN